MKEGGKLDGQLKKSFNTEIKQLATDVKNVYQRPENEMNDFMLNKNKFDYLDSKINELK